ncbi:hypothetical protein ACFQFH_05005 [Halobaculum halobium]|nr:hypothetical protein [Halobaculum sp. SYNS20]
MRDGDERDLSDGALTVDAFQRVRAVDRIAVGDAPSVERAVPLGSVPTPEESRPSDPPAAPRGDEAAVRADVGTERDDDPDVVTVLW